MFNPFSWLETWFQPEQPTEKPGEDFFTPEIQLKILTDHLGAYWHALDNLEEFMRANFNKSYFNEFFHAKHQVFLDFGRKQVEEIAIQQKISMDDVNESCEKVGEMTTASDSDELWKQYKDALLVLLCVKYQFSGIFKTKNQELLKLEQKIRKFGLGEFDRFLLTHGLAYFGWYVKQTWKPASQELFDYFGVIWWAVEYLSSFWCVNQEIIARNKEFEDKRNEFYCFGTARIGRMTEEREMSMDEMEKVHGFVGTVKKAETFGEMKDRFEDVIVTLERNTEKFEEYIATMDREVKEFDKEIKEFVDYGRKLIDGMDDFGELFEGMNDAEKEFEKVDKYGTC